MFTFSIRQCVDTEIIASHRLPPLNTRKTGCEAFLHAHISVDGSSPADCFMLKLNIGFRIQFQVQTLSVHCSVEDSTSPLSPP